MKTAEQTWIESIQRRWPQTDFGHDTFIDPNTQQIFTTDMLVEDVHFSWTYCTPYDIGWKALAVSLSDIAATGGLPQYALISIGINPSTSTQALAQLYDGIEACAKAFHCQVIGGDTVRAEKTVISITVTGTAPENATLGRRTGAQAGDIIAISGPHGLSQAGLWALQNNVEGYQQLKKAHLQPQPQVALGQKIAQHLTRFAIMDSSDGLADAALRLAQANKVSIILNSKQLTIDPVITELAKQAQINPMDWVLYGGEDFQLVVCLPAEQLTHLPELTPIGHVLADNPGQAFLKQESQLIPLSYQHTFQHWPSGETA